jgi:hypothetical protein
MSKWVYRQRNMKRLGKLVRKERLDKLDKIGFLWSARSALEQSKHIDLPTFSQRRASAPDISCDDSLDCATNVNHNDLLARTDRFGNCSTVASPQEGVLTLNTHLVSASVHNTGCDDQNESPPGHKSHTVDERSARLDDTILFESERDKCIAGRLPLNTNTQTKKPKRMRRREGGCRAREIVIHQMQSINFAPDSVGHKVMSRVLAKLTAKGDMRI